jgi:hypothetical protein
MGDAIRVIVAHKPQEDAIIYMREGNGKYIVRPENVSNVYQAKCLWSASSHWVISKNQAVP